MEVKDSDEKPEEDVSRDGVNGVSEANKWEEASADKDTAPPSESDMKSGAVPLPSQNDTVTSPGNNTETPNTEPPSVNAEEDPTPTPPTIEDPEPEPTSTDKKSKKKKKKGKGGSGLNAEETVVAEPVAEEERSGSEAKLEPDLMEETAKVEPEMTEVPQGEMEPIQEAQTTIGAVPDEAHPEDSQDVSTAKEEPKSVEVNNASEQSLKQEQTAEPTPIVKEADNTALLAAQQRITALEAQITELAHSQEKAASLEHDLDERSKRISSLEADVSRLREVEELARKREEEVSALRRELEEVREDASAESARLIDEVKRLNREVEERLERQRERERGLEIEVNRLKQVRSYFRRLEVVLNESQEHHEVVAAQDDSEAELAQMKDQHSDLLREKAQLEEAHGTLQTAHDELSAALQANEKELDNLRLQLAERTTALTESTTRVGTLESSTATLTAAQESLRAQLAKETKRAEGAQSSREALLVDNQGLMSQLEEMRERNGQVMKDLAELGEERDALAGTVDKLEVCCHLAA